MRKEKNHFQFWLSDEDAKHFTDAVARTGLSQTAYFRQLINDMVPQDRPPREFRDILGEMYKIENAYRAMICITAGRGLDTAELQKQYEAIGREIEELTKRIYEPIPVRYVKESLHTKGKYEQRQTN